MLIDFCHPSVRPRVVADKVALDGYEVANLISEDAQLKSRGFMCESFIRPPVNITVKFPCNISIYRIVIDPVIGRQQSCDMKLFTATLPVSDSWLFGCKDNDMFTTDGILFSFVGSTCQQAPNTVCFQNASFHERNIWRTTDMPSLESYPIPAQLVGRKHGVLSNVSHLTVSVTRTKSGGAVAIRRLEIWGIPSVKLAYDKQLLLQKCFNIGQRRNISASKEFSNRSHAPRYDLSEQQANIRAKESECVAQDKLDEVSEQKAVAYSEQTVPDDFLDQLTYEIMAVPMLLPCGKHIDQSTLERFVNIEASWGRAPSDPFTAVAFTAGRNAVPDPILKSRIDDFLSKQSQLNVPRTLGTSECDRFEVRKFKSSRLVDSRKFTKSSTPPPPPKGDTDTSVSCLRERSGAVASNENIAISYARKARKRKHTLDSPLARVYSVEDDKGVTCRDVAECTDSPVKKKSLDAVVPLHDSFEEKDFSTCNFLRTALSPEKNKTDITDSQKASESSLELLKLGSGPVLSHSDSLSSSLEFALNSALANCPKFSTFTKKSQQPVSNRDRHSLQPVSSKDRLILPQMGAKNIITSKTESGKIGAISQPVLVKDTKIIPSDKYQDVRCCCLCETRCMPAMVTYRLPCNHLICRNCLRKQHTTNVRCSVCKCEFPSREIIRVFN